MLMKFIPSIQNASTAEKTAVQYGTAITTLQTFVFL